LREREDLSDDRRIGRRFIEGRIAMIPFTKMHGNGNDFLVICNTDLAFSTGDLSALALDACRRKESVGADGILVIEPSERANFRMRIFNADGSEGEMCGNGARCIARYAFENGMAPESMVFETLAGLIRAGVNGERVSLDLGEICLKDGWFGDRLMVRGAPCASVYLKVGVPHCVVFLDDFAGYSRDDLREIGREIRNDAARFPEGTNVNFIVPEPPSDVRAVTYERGVEDLTESCGTGCVAGAIACAVTQGMESPIFVHNPGGTNEVGLVFSDDNERCRATLTGRTVVVARGVLLSRDAIRRSMGRNES
jgi:diaminopimelate epimerase